LIGGDYGLYKNGDPSNSHSIATVRLVLPRTTRTFNKSTNDNDDSHNLLSETKTQESTENLQLSGTSITNEIVNDDPYTSMATTSVPTTTTTTSQRPLISVKEFLAFSRVQNHVAKNTLLTFHNPDTQQIGFLVSNFLYVSDRLA